MNRDATISISTALGVLFVAIQVTLAFYVWRYGPEGRVPVHFSLDGVPNGWASRGQNAVSILGLVALTMVLRGMFWIFAHSPRTDAVTRKVLRMIDILVAAIITASAVLVASLALKRFDPSVDTALFVRLVIGGVAVIFALTGALIGKATPNPYAGVRVKWTFESRLAWDKANRLTGRIFFLGGLLTLLALPFVRPPLLVALGIGTPVLGSVLGIVEAWRVWRSDPERVR